MNYRYLSHLKMNTLSVVKEESIKSEMDFEDEPMDVIETPTDAFCEEGEISSSEDEKSVTVQMPSNVTSIFTRHQRKDQTGGFVTGFNIFDKDETQKKLDRAKRFSIPFQTINTEEVHKEKLPHLYRDLGIDKENERHYRFNAVHMRGTNNMSTGDVLQYFRSFAPSHVEWINDVSCNIVWLDDVSAARALLNLTKRIKNLDKVHFNADPFEKELKEDSQNEETDNEEAVDAREIKAAIPPGFWRIGEPCEKSSFLLLRFATRSDKKQKNAEKNSDYYKKYGNPHYGNLPGLISNSLRSEIKKSRYRASDFDHLPGRGAEQISDKRNPWKELAFEWGKTDRVEDSSQKCVENSVVQDKTFVPDLRLSLTNKKEKGKRIMRDFITSSYSSDKEIWESKSKVPRMKMYADEEEKRLGKNLEKKLQSGQIKRELKEDLRSKINRKKTRPRLKFRSEKKFEQESSESSSNENEYEDGDSGNWALEHYHDLRESLQQSRKQESKRFNAVSHESESEGDNMDDEIFKRDVRCRSPLEIEIENDEYFLNKA